MLLKKVGLILLIVVGLIGTIYFFGAPPFVSRLNTTYTKGFTKDKLVQVREGMTENEVLNILGKPMLSHTKDYSCSTYSTAKTQWSDYIGWEAVVVCYSDDDIVKGIGENIFYN